MHLMQILTCTSVYLSRFSFVYCIIFINVVFYISETIWSSYLRFLHKFLIKRGVGDGDGCGIPHP
jgi:hypothetical protein